MVSNSKFNDCLLLGGESGPAEGNSFTRRTYSTFPFFSNYSRKSSQCKSVILTTFERFKSLFVNCRAQVKSVLMCPIVGVHKSTDKRIGLRDRRSIHKGIRFGVNTEQSESNRKLPCSLNSVLSQSAEASICIWQDLANRPD